MLLGSNFLGRMNHSSRIFLLGLSTVVFITFLSYSRAEKSCLIKGSAHNTVSILFLIKDFHSRLHNPEKHRQQSMIWWADWFLLSDMWWAAKDVYLHPSQSDMPQKFYLVHVTFSVWLRWHKGCISYRDHPHSMYPLKFRKLVSSSCRLSCLFTVPIYARVSYASPPPQIFSSFLEFWVIYCLKDLKMQFLYDYVRT